MSVRTEKNGSVSTIILSRPEKRNAMDPEHANALVDAFLAFEADSNARVAVLWGEGAGFCAGWDLSFVGSLENEDRPLKSLEYPLGGAAIPRGPLGPTRLDLSKPVIGAVAGAAVAGGFELALWCDLRLMEESAYFGVYCRRWGVPLIDGGTVRLPRLVGQGRAMEIILTGRQVCSDEAYRIGACEDVVPDGTVRIAAEKLAKQIARFPPKCTNADRRSVYLQHGLSVQDAMAKEWYNGIPALIEEGAKGANKFVSGKGRHGDFDDI